MTYTLEIRDAASESKVLSIDRVLIVGREDVDVVVADPAISRRHAQVTPTPDGPVVADLGSRNGTFVNDEPVQEPQLLRVGDVIGIGDSTLLVGNVEGSARATIAPQRQPARGDLAPPSGQGIHRPIAVRPALRDLEAVDAGAAVIRFRQGTAGAAAARLVAADAARARQRLAGFGSESWGVKPQICLVDPFHNPNDPNAVVADGCVIDPVNNEIWMVVTPESPPEPLDRALALLFGASFPAASELTPLIEGYGLHVGGAADVDPELRKIDLPPLPAATGELQSAMALSFVRFLLDRSGDQAFRSFLGSAQPGRLDAAASSVYGAGFGQLDAEWRQHLQSAHEAVSLKHFIGLSLQFLRPHVGRQIEIFAYMFVGLAFTLTFPFATRRLFDRAIPSGEFSQVVQLLVVLSVVFVISTLANVRRAYLSAYVSGAVIRDLRLELFGRLQDLDTRWYHRNPKGDVLSRLFTDVGQVESGLSQTVREGVFQALSLVVASVVMLTLDVRLGLIVLISLPLMAFVYRSMGEGARRRSIAVQRATSSLLDAAAENYDAEPVVKMFGLGRHERGRFESISERLFERQRRLVLFGGMFSLSVNLIVTVVRLAVLGLGAWLILDGRMTIGTLVAFFGIMGEVVNPVTTLTSLGQELQAASGGLIRVREVLNETPAVRDADGAIALPPVTRELRFDNVTFGYTAGHPVLENVSFVIPAGARAAFVGPSGSGKSTILRLLMRVYDPASGVVAADGHDLRSVTVDSLRSQMGVVFQDSFLFDTTIRENIALGAPWSDAAMIEAAAQAAEVTAFLPNLPSGLDTMVGGRGAQLSGGQRQRVAIARALVRNPRILLLDEATSSLDPRSERQIVDTLNRASAGRTTVAITHRLASVVDYDIIFVLVDGRLVEQGDHRQLLERGGTYAMLWAEQTGEAAAPARFDPVPALAKVPIFSGLSPTELAEVAALAQPRQLVQSERLADDERLLAILARGRAVVYRRGVADELVPVAELVEGDCYGLRALLDEHTSTVLEASEPTMLLVLGDEALTALTARFPTLAEALVRGPSAYAPVGGRVMGRSTLSSVGALPQLRRSDAAEVPAPSPPQRGDR